MRRGMVIGFLMVLVAGWSMPARADFLVSIGSASIPQGGTGTIDILLTSTASSAAPDLLNNLGFTLQIGGPSFLAFSGSQTFGYLSSPDYAFAGDSLDQATSSPGGTVGNTVYPNDTFVGSDSTNSGNPVSLTSSNTPVLLATLTLDATITSIGETYTIGLVPPTGSGSSAGGAKTFFDVFDFNTGGETSVVPFTSTAGTITIIAASVPEPGSLLLGLSAVVLMAGAGRARMLQRSKRAPTRIR